jgi:hypothetical protein
LSVIARLPDRFADLTGSADNRPARREILAPRSAGVTTRFGGILYRAAQIGAADGGLEP